MHYAKSRPVSKNLSNTIGDDLRLRGWSLIPHAVESVEEFSNLFSRFTTKLTFDPARENVSEVAQSVDAGTAAVGLHIENGNTPLPPDTIAALKLGASPSVAHSFPLSFGAIAHSSTVSRTRVLFCSR